MSSFPDPLFMSRRFSGIYHTNQKIRRPSNHHGFPQPLSEVFVCASLDSDPETIAKLVRDRSRVYAHGNPDQYLETKHGREYRNLRVRVIPTTNGDEIDDLESDFEPMMVDDCPPKWWNRNFRQNMRSDQWEDGRIENSAETKSSGNSPRESPLSYPRPESAPELTPEMLSKIEEIKQIPFDNDVIPCKSPYRVLKLDWATLSGKAWLDDVIIKWYLYMIQERSKTLHQMYVEEWEKVKKEGATVVNELSYYPLVFCFEPSFYILLSSSSAGYEAVEGMTEGKNIFKYELIYFPVWRNDHHWRLVVAHVDGKNLTMFNSLKSLGRERDQEICENISDYLKKEWRKEHAGEESEWKINLDEIVPQQDGCTECGVFILQFAEYVSRIKRFDFGMEHMPYFRQKMMYECIMGELMS